MTVAEPDRLSALTRRWAHWRQHTPAVVPGLIAVALMVLWAEHDGGYDADTWYWGALVLLALVTAVVLGRGVSRATVSRRSGYALAAFGLYVAWSYLSIAWAQSPGTALEGSNRALLYLILFALMTIVPWTPQAARVALVAFALGIGAIAIAILLKLAAGDQVAQLVVDRRLEAPAGYFNASAALFTMGALLSTALASRRQLPGILRGVLIALASAELELAVMAQSRGWLFTLPLVLIVTVVLVPDRLRFGIAAILPTAAAVIPVHRLVSLFSSDNPTALRHAAERAGQASLVLCTAMLVVGTVIAWSEGLVGAPQLTRTRRRQIGTVAVVVVVAVGLLGGSAATHGDPLGFVKRQWQGFSNPTSSIPSGSHFATVGTSRYDFWRVAIKGFASNPIGGLGQDNFADYYVSRRRTSEEPAWTHSLELRLLTHTGVVGFVLFFTFLASAVAAALIGRRRGDPLTAQMAAWALLPLVVWLIHGSIDWFWELPALAGPALGFLGMAGSLSSRTAVATGGREPSAPAAAPRVAAARSLHRVAAMLGVAVSILAASITLGLPYLSVREFSLASDAQATDPAGALADLSRAADLNPLNSEPGRLGGSIALQNGEYVVAEQRFRQSIAREPGGWFAWLGAGLAASAQGLRQQAHRDFATAYAINSRAPAVRQALDRVNGSHPLTAGEAFKLLVIAH